MQTAPPETDFSMAGTPWISNWYQWDGNDGLIKVLEEYSSYNEGYRFIIPENWQGKYTIDKSVDEDLEIHSLHFIYLDPNTENKEKVELMVIHHVPKAKWTQREQRLQDNNKPYVLLGENDENMLVVELGQYGDMLSEENLKVYEGMLLDKENVIESYIAIGSNTKLLNIDDGKVTDEQNTQTEYELNEDGVIKPEVAKEIIEATSYKIMNAINNKDSQTVSEFVHPDKGVRFTPYTYVSIEDDVVFNKEDTKNFFEDKNFYLWGHYDGTGDDIRLTSGEYYERFIYSEDFVNAEEIGYNEVLSSGNMLENQFEVYENAIVAEYYFPGFNPDYAGIDWKSLRLVFEQYEGNWNLVGIIHNQWTI